MSARDTIARCIPGSSAEMCFGLADGIMNALTTAGHVILSPDEVRGIRDEALDDAIRIASRHPGTKFTNSRGHLDWRPADNHDAAAAIRSLKGDRDAQ